MIVKAAFVNLKALPKMLSMIPSVLGGVDLHDLQAG